MINYNTYLASGDWQVKQINGYDTYFITDSGEVWSNARGPLKKLKDCDAGNGYRVVSLCKDNMQKNYAIHRLVAEYYIPNPDNLPQVCHKDDNPANNQVSNLFWGTQKMNMEDKIKKGRGAPQHGKHNGMYGRVAWNRK